MEIIPGIETGRKLSAIFEMLDLLNCVSCSDLPFEKVWTPGNCCHKYCKACLKKLSTKQCIVCQAAINPKDREVDLFSTNLITQLLQLQRAVDPDSEYQTKRVSRLEMENHEPSALDHLYSDENFPIQDKVSIKNSKTPKPVPMEIEELGDNENNEIPLLVKANEKNKKSVPSTFKEPRAAKILINKSIDKAEPDSEKVKGSGKEQSKAEKKSTLKRPEKKQDSETLTGDMCAKMFAFSSSDEEELPSLTPHPVAGEKKRASALASKVTPSGKTPNEKPKLEVQVSLERLESPNTRSRRNAIKPGPKSRRRLGGEFGAAHKESGSIVDDKPKPTFVKPEPVKVDTTNKIFRTRSRSSSLCSNSEEDSSGIKLGRKSRTEVRGKAKAQTNKEDSKERSISPDDDVYDFKSQSKKVVPKKKGKGVKIKRKRFDSDSSTTSSIISNVSVKKEVSTPKTNQSSRQNSSTGNSNNHAIKNSPGINKRNAKGETVLHIAVRTGKLEKVKELIENGAEVDAKDFAGWTPLHEAINAKTPTLEMVQMLCDSGADVNALGMGNSTPLHEASRLDLVDIVRYLLSQSASAAIRNSTGKLPKNCSESSMIKKIFGDHEEEMCGQSQSNDISVELKVSLQKAIFYFACDVPKNVLKNAKALWDITISAELTKKVTHVIFDAKPKTKVPLNFDFLLSILNGTWILSYKWLEDSLSVKRFLDPRKYQLNGCVYDNIPSSTGDDIAVERARVNRDYGNPSLFKGFNFYIYKNTNWPPNVKGGKSNISLNKKDIGKLVQFGDGIVINREPNPDMVDPLETPVRFHARQDEGLLEWDSASSVQDHKLTLTSHVILYDDKNVPPVKHNLEHVKTLKIDWLIHSAVHFRLLYPDSYL